MLYIEKEGFNELIDAARLCERYDIGLMSGKGESTTAARELAEEFCSTYDMPLLLVHDFDRAGFEIAAVLQRNTERYKFTKRFNVIDLGLSLADAQDYNLPKEAWREKMSHASLQDQLRRNDATDEEIEYLCNGMRVELNAFTSPQFIEWLERKLDQAGVRKLVPDQSTLEQVYRAGIALDYFQEHTRHIAGQAREYADNQPVPDELVEQVQGLLVQEPDILWTEAVQRLVSTTAKD